MPLQFWPKSDSEDTIDSPELECRKSNDVIQNESIIEKKSDLFDIFKYSNLEKILRITTWLKRFI